MISYIGTDGVQPLPQCRASHQRGLCDSGYTLFAVRQDGVVREYLTFYIDGHSVDPAELRPFDVENPATEQVCGRIALGGSADVEHRLIR